MSPIRNIRRPNVSEELYHQFKDAISRGEWAPGSQIPSENELAAMSGVSRVTVRAALQKLSSVGLIESRQGEGTFVQKYSSVDFMENLLPVMQLAKSEVKALLEFRSIFETGNAGLAAINRTEEDLSAMEAVYQKHKQCGKDYKKAAECDLEFHFLIAQATKNPFIVRSHAVLKEIFRSALHHIVAVMGIEHAMKYHKEIIEAIRMQDVARAKAIMSEHVEDTFSVLGNKE